MKYDIGDIILFRSLNKHFMITYLYNFDGVPFYDLECLEDGIKNMFPQNTLNICCDLVQKGRK